MKRAIASSAARFCSCAPLLAARSFHDLSSLASWRSMRHDPRMTEAQTFTLINGELGVALDSEHIGTMEIRRPPNNFFDTALIEAIADALERLQGLEIGRAHV